MDLFDDQMKGLRATLLAVGKGRRPSLPELRMDNKLLYQLHILRQETNCSGKEVEKWFARLFPESSYPAARFCRHLDRVAIKVDSISCPEEKAAFLALMVDLDFISEALDKQGVNRHMDFSNFIKCALTNEIVADLHTFTNKEKLSQKFFISALNAISSVPIACSMSSFSRLMKKFDKTYKTLQAKKDKTALQTWMKANFVLPEPTVPVLAVPAISTCNTFASEQPAPMATSSVTQIATASTSSSYPAISICNTFASEPPAPMATSSVTQIATASTSISQPAISTCNTFAPEQLAPMATSSVTQIATASTSISQPAISTCNTFASEQLAPMATSSVTQIATASTSISQPAISTCNTFASEQLAPMATSSVTQIATASTSISQPAISTCNTSAASHSLVTASQRPHSFAEMKSNKEFNALQRSLRDAQDRIASLGLQLEAVTEQYTDNKAELARIELKHKKLATENCNLKLSIKKLNEVLGSHDEITKSKLYKNNQKMKKKFSALQTYSGNLSTKIKTLNDEIKELKLSKLSLQKNLSKAKKINKQLRQEKDNIDSGAIKDILEGCKEPQTTRDSHCNRFSDKIRMTIIGLQESGVAASKCSDVIHTVARHLFDTELTDLPSSSTAVNIADEAHFLSKAQAAQKIMKSADTTLHTDGTSRQKRKYVGQQITLSDGSLISLGFSEVATEDAETLLTTTINLFDELSDIYCDVTDEVKSDISKQMLEHVTSVMSDRAAVMQSFNTKLQQYKEDQLHSKSQLHFLYCNAHFLLGLSTACESGLQEVEGKARENEGPLGRESSAQFKHWSSSEAATSRLIRTAADVLGPRGDEKSGVREEWLAFCRKEELKSEITSYRSNRFNSLFENASAIFHHRFHIKLFLQDFSTSTNRKLQSVLADISDVRLQSLLTAVALLHVYITKPYWNLLNSAIPYVDFHKYVQMMVSNLEAWKEEPHHLLDTECKGAFNGEFLDEVDTSLHEFATQQELVATALKVLLSKFIQVSLRQLKDFLPDGVFGKGVSENVEAALRHCPLTNLSGEHAFGDLDYSMHVKRHTSLHHHSTTNMLKRNKTTAWLAAKSPADLQSNLKISRKRARALRKKHRRQEELVKLRIQERIAENERLKKEKEMAAVAEKQRITEAVIKLGGPVKSVHDINTLLKHHSNGVEVLKAQLRYIKIVLGIKSIKTSGSRAQLQTYLQEFVTGEKSSISSPPRKRRRIATSDDQLNTSTEDSSPFESEDSSEDESAMTHSFAFDRQGQWVAVYYDSSLYIGQVIETETKSVATVKFLAATKGRKDYFKWPLAEDIASVDSTFVFKWDFDVIPISSDGRIWSVPDIDSITKAYNRIRDAN